MGSAMEGENLKSTKKFGVNGSESDGQWVYERACTDQDEGLVFSSHRMDRQSGS